MKITAEQQLIEGILRGEEGCLRRFYKTYSPKLLSFIKQRVSEEKDAEEILQDVFFASLESLRDFTYKCKLETFLCAIAKNKVIDYYRKKKLKKILFSQIPEVEPLLAVLTTPEEKLDEKLLKQSIDQTLKNLTPRYEKILRLKYIEGFSVKEVAQKLSLTFKSAESLLFRARREFVKVYTGI